MVVRSHLSPAALDRLFHALADTTRRDIVTRLLGGHEASVSNLAARYDMVTATEILSADAPPGITLYGRLRECLLGLGIEKPRVKIMPVFPAGRLAGRAVARLTEEQLEGFDRSLLQCAEARVVADGGVYACPILAGLPQARLSDGGLAASFGPAPLGHAACVTCYKTGMSCRNY